MTNPHPIVGARVAVFAGVPEEVNHAALVDLEYVPVRGVRVVGDLATSYQTSPFLPLGAALPVQRRVSRAPASLQLDLARLSDPGQAILRRALNPSSHYSYRIDLPGIGAHYFTARVSSRILGVGAATDLADVSVTLDVTSEIFEPL